MLTRFPFQTMHAEFESDDSSTLGELSSYDGILTNSEGIPIIIPLTPPRTLANVASVRRLFDGPIRMPPNPTSVVTNRGFTTRSECIHSPLPGHRPQRPLQSEPSTSDSRSTQGQMEAILQELRQTNKKLHHITDRLDVVESRLKANEESSVAPISDTTAAPKKEKVPLQARVTKPHSSKNVYLPFKITFHVVLKSVQYLSHGDSASLLLDNVQI